MTYERKTGGGGGGVSDHGALTGLSDNDHPQYALASGAWTAYTPTWAAETSNPTLGDGTIGGAYRLDGKTLFIRVELVWGSTTSGGSGPWTFGLPASITAVTGVAQAVPAFGQDASSWRLTGKALIGVRPGADADYFDRFVVSNYQGDWWRFNYPIAWANGDRIAFTGVIEVA